MTLTCSLSARVIAAVVLACAIPAGSSRAMPPPGCHLLFDGIDDRVPTQDIGAGALFQWTLSAWIQTTGADGFQSIISRGEDVFFDILPWAMGTTGTGQVYVQIEDSAGAGSFLCLSNTLVNDGLWHHVVATRDVNNVVAIYIDGGLLFDVACPGAPTTLNVLDATMGIGFSYQGAGGASNPQPAALFFDGSIDEPALWRTALTLEEVNTVLLGGPFAVARYFPGTQIERLVSYWPLNEGAEQIANDVVTNQDGTIGATTGVDFADPVWVCTAPPIPALGGAKPWLVVAAVMLVLAAYYLRPGRPPLRS